MDETEVFGAVGEEGFTRLTGAFYRQIHDDEILGPMYPKDDLAGAEQRLRDYLIYPFVAAQRDIERNADTRACGCAIPRSRSRKPRATAGCNSWTPPSSKPTSRPTP